MQKVVRGFSLVPGQDCTTLKGRTTIVFGIWPVRLPRTFQVLAMTGWSVILSPSLHVILSEAKNLTPLRVNSAKNPSHSSGRCLEILRRPYSFGLLSMTLLRALIWHL